MILLWERHYATQLAVKSYKKKTLVTLMRRMLNMLDSTDLQGQGQGQVVDVK